APKGRVCWLTESTQVAIPRTSGECATRPRFRSTRAKACLDTTRAERLGTTRAERLDETRAEARLDMVTSPAVGPSTFASTSKSSSFHSPEGREADAPFEDEIVLLHRQAPKRFTPRAFYLC